jgi:hypothetical protein
MTSPPAGTTHSAEWPDLITELDRWGEGGHVARFWWRDDDAVAPTAQLERLLGLAHGIPLALAVIPVGAEPSLAAAIAGEPNIAVIQHGWSHANHGGGKKSEYPAERPAADVAAELVEAKARLTALFGARARPILAPPWNRFAAEFVPLLAKAGIAGLSQMAPRRGPNLPCGIAAVDVHFDVVAWHADRGFVGANAALARLIGELQQRRGSVDPAIPIGLLTHHPEMDSATAEFLARLGEVIAAHSAVRWARVDELMAVQ